MAIIPALDRIPHLQSFLEQCHIRQYPVRTAIVHAGDASDSLFFIVKGSVSVVIEDSEGREMVVAYLKVIFLAKWVYLKKSPSEVRGYALKPPAKSLKLAIANLKKWRVKMRA